MSDQAYGKKIVEEMELDHFLDAYQHATGQPLVKIGSSERPDFICARPTGEQVGVELTAVPADFVWLSSGLYDTVVNKATKKDKGDWAHADRTILVLTLEFSISERIKEFEAMVKEDFDLGFEEVWAADYTEVDAFGNVELFGLFPKAVWGFHRRPNWASKPYG